ncbi:MAG: ABC transporter permease, partial [Chloroflexi bacterium]|nr:ABC transporter permease [Chloroflexota bacterium]
RVYVRFLELTFWGVVLAGAFRLATPIAFAALGETLAERSGILNLGIEGMMLVGALAGVAGSHYGGSAAGVASGGVAGGLLAAAMGWVVLKGRANQIVVGIAVSLFGAGVAAYAFQLWLPSGRSSVIAPLVPTIEVPLLSTIPLIGEAFFHQSLLTYACLALAPATIWALRSTNFGLALRAAGDDPAAAELRGVNVLRTRGLALLAAGVLAGIGGAAITVGYLGSFSDDVTAGRGFIAIAVVIIGSWTPLGAWGGALLFAFFDSLSLQAQTGGIVLPVEAYSALPYLVTLLVLIGTSKRRRAPRALGQPLPA